MRLVRRILICVLFITLLGTMSIEAYENHCWNCNSHISSNYCERCAECGWYICNECGACNWDCSYCFKHYTSSESVDDDLDEKAYEAYLAEEEAKRNQAEMDDYRDYIDAQDETDSQVNTNGYNDDPSDRLFEMVFIWGPFIVFFGVLAIYCISSRRELKTERKEAEQKRLQEDQKRLEDEQKRLELKKAKDAAEKKQFQISALNDQHSSWKEKRADYEIIVEVAEEIDSRLEDVSLPDSEAEIALRYYNWFEEILDVFYDSGLETGRWCDQYLKKIEPQNAKEFNYYAFKYYVREYNLMIERYKEDLDPVTRYYNKRAEVYDVIDLKKPNTMINVVTDVTGITNNRGEYQIKKDNLTKAYVRYLQRAIFKEEFQKKNNQKIVNRIEEITNSSMKKIESSIDRKIKKNEVTIMRSKNNDDFLSRYDIEDDDNIPF